MRRYRRSGSGASLRGVKPVLLHALPLDGRSWDKVAGLLEGDVLAPTLYGLGDTVEEWAQAVLRLAGSEPLVLVGNSVGGSCAIDMALLAPEQVRHMVLVSAKAGHRPEPEFRDQVIGLLREQGVQCAWTRYWASLVAPTASDEQRRHLEGLALAQSVPDLVRGVSAFHGRRDRAAFVDAWEGPITVVSGEFDIAPERAKRAARALSQGRFVHLPGVGHFAPVEAPRALAAVVSEAAG